MEECSDELHCAFRAFCDFAERGSTVCTGKTLNKICTDCGIYSKELDQPRVDIQFRKFTGNAKRDVNFNGFVEFINGPFSDAYACVNKLTKAAAIEELKNKIATGTPKPNKTTEPECDAGLEMLCNPKLYTGTQKQRFEEIEQSRETQ